MDLFEFGTNWRLDRLGRHCWHCGVGVGGYRRKVDRHPKTAAVHIEAESGSFTAELNRFLISVD